MADDQGLPLDPRLQANILDLTSAGANRVNRTEPIHEAAMAMARHMAPDYAQGAMGALPSRTDPSTIAQRGLSTGANGADGGSNLAKALAGLLGGLGAANGGKLPIQQLIDYLKKKFAHDQSRLRRTGQGNKPYPGGALPSGNPGMNGFTGWADNGDNGEDYNRWPGSGDPTPNVDTSYDINGFDPSVLFGNGFDPNSQPNWDLLYGLFNGSPSDPSGGSGVGPGMQDYRGGDGGGPGADWWDDY